jgi:transmembrane sensor
VSSSGSHRTRLEAIAPRHIRAQAALWVTDLHGPNRDSRLEASVRRWIAEDPRHAAAFELATEAWQRSGNLPASALVPPPNAHALGLARRHRAPPRLTRPALAGMAALGAVLFTVFYLLKDNTLTTGPAEQRTLVLSDGTQVSLDANSRLVVQYDDHVRQVTLTSGEALFDVTKHQARPFVVVIGDRKVIALGTSFEVRRDDPAASAFAVTLMEGRVAIEPLAWPNTLPPEQSPGLTLLNPGQRLRFAANGSDSVDSPSIDRVTSWQHGQLIFEDASLREAANEFNRVGIARLLIDESVPRDIRVGGVFRIADPMSFARAMTNAYPLRIVDRGKEIIITNR